MKRMNLRKTIGAAVLIGGTIVAANAIAQPRDANDHGYGMMGGYDHGQGYNMGPRMMGGNGHGCGMAPGMGPGMMGDYGPQSNLNLSAEQRGKIAKIQGDTRHKHWELMGKLQDEQAHMNEQNSSDDGDDAALSKSYRRMSELRQEMFDLSLSARKQVNAVLTKEQREKLKRG